MTEQRAVAESGTQRAKGNIELPTGYYLDNFLVVLDFVDGLYDDVLDASEQNFSREFRALSNNAQRLYVRLISRKGPHFRAEKIQYPEIDVAKAAQELSRSGFFNVDDITHASDWLDLLNRSELEDMIRDKPKLFGETGGLGSCKKADLIERILTKTDSETLTNILSAFGPFFTPLHGEALLVYRLLFFGNLSQDLTEFVLLDLGLIRYETYRLGFEDRVFESRKTVEDTLAYAASREMLAEALESDDLESVKAVIDFLPDPGAAPRLIRRRDRLLNKAGRYFERKAVLGANASDPELLDLAIFCYERAGTPPARERLARVHDRLGMCDHALVICQSILETPRDPMEAMFAETFQVKMRKKLGMDFTPIVRKRHPHRDLILDRVPGERIEETVLNGLNDMGITGFYAENLFWRGLFGLAFWDIVFMPVKGAFFNYYQRGPRGLFSPGFREERRAPIETRLVEIREDPSWPGRVLDLYDLKFGIANYLVAWSFLPKDRIERVVFHFERPHLADIFDRLSQDIGTFKSGFPDLVIFPGEEPGYELAEVKGPTDQLQPNQHRWLRFLSQRGIPYRIIKVSWK